jgi:hypothetical protein
MLNSKPETQNFLLISELNDPLDHAVGLAVEN